jgi:hypothetical protein
VTNSNNKIYFSISAKDALDLADELYGGWIHGDEVKHEIWQTKFRPVETTRLIVSHGRTTSHGDVTSWGHVSGSGATIGTGGTPENPTYVDMSSSSNASSDAGAAIDTESETETEAEVPWYEHEEFKELTGRTFRSIDEVKERYKGFLIRQDPRRFQWKLHQIFPRAIVAPDVKPIDLPPWERREFFAKMLETQGRPGVPLFSKKQDVLKAID